jgi:hypothetical protein
MSIWTREMDRRHEDGVVSFGTKIILATCVGITLTDLLVMGWILQRLR